MAIRLKITTGALWRALWLTFAFVVTQLGVAFFVAITALYLFVSLANLVIAGEIQRFDERVVAYFQTHQPNWLHQPLLAITFWANGPTIAVIAAASIVGFALAKRFWPDGITMAVASGGGLILIESLKGLFDRPRPIAIAPEGGSFPSGHAFFSLVIYSLLAYRLSVGVPMSATHKRSLWLFAVLAALLIGSSRVLLGVHFPSDVLAGFAAGFIWLWGCLALPRAFKKRDWKQWKTQRLESYREGVTMLRELRKERPSLERLARQWSESPSIRPTSQLLLRAALGYVRVHDAIARHWPFFASISEDLVVLGAALRRVHPAKHPHEFEDLLERLYLARRNLFGTTMPGHPLESASTESPV